jgi:Zn-finger nucleic acid-binding protein
MEMKTCANCSQPMRAVVNDHASFEQCPKCGGAWIQAGQFEALLASKERHIRSSAHHEGHSSFGDVLPARQFRTLLKAGAAAAAGLVLIVGVAGYFVVWPLVKSTVTNGTLTKIGAEVVGKQGKSLAVPADIGSWAQQTAKKTAEDAMRKAVGLPVKEAAAGETKAESPEGAETEK